MPTVLIAAASNLGHIKQRNEYREAIAFADTDALRALEAITRQRPELVVLESAFAATSRGTALINRIKADPSLAGCEVRILSPNAGADVTPAPAPAPVTVAIPIPIPEAPATPPVHAPALLDKTGTRRTPRFAIAGDLEVLVDGNPATLLDLSLGGAQLMSLTTLKPNQRVRLTLPGSVPIRVSGEIAWAMFEMPQSGPRYRAGMQFADPDAKAIQRFIESNRK